MNLTELKVAILDKFNNKSDLQLHIDVLQQMIVDQYEGFNVNEVKGLFTNAVGSLVSEGKLIVDTTSVMIDSHIG